MIFSKFGDVFESPHSHSLAHCISSDGAMSKGIAKQFVTRFPILCSLRDSSNCVGMAVPISARGNFIYNLVTKERFWMKPSIHSLSSSLRSMLLHAELNKVTDISMPRLASGCDRMDFGMDVLPQLKLIFSFSTINIHVYSGYAVPRYVLYCCRYNFVVSLCGKMMGFRSLMLSDN